MHNLQVLISSFSIEEILKKLFWMVSSSLCLQPHSLGWLVFICLLSPDIVYNDQTGRNPNLNPLGYQEELVLRHRLGTAGGELYKKGHLNLNQTLAEMQQGSTGFIIEVEIHKKITLTEEANKRNNRAMRRRTKPTKNNSSYWGTVHIWKLLIKRLRA